MVRSSRRGVVGCVWRQSAAGARGCPGSQRNTRGRGVIPPAAKLTWQIGVHAARLNSVVLPREVRAEHGSWERAVFYPSCAAAELCAPWGRPRDVTGNLPRVMLNERLKAPSCFLPWGQHEAVLVCIVGHKKALDDGTDRYFIGKVWEDRVNYRTNISKRGPKTPFKEGPRRSSAAPTQPTGIQKRAECGHVTSRLHVPLCGVRAGSTCVRNMCCQQGCVRHADRILALLPAQGRSRHWLGTRHAWRQASATVPRHGMWLQRLGMWPNCLPET